MALRWQDWWPRPTSKLGKTAWWSFVVWLVVWPLELAHGLVSDAAGLVRFVAALVFFCAAIPWTIRWFRSKFLWRLSNRLVVTYLLVGLAPFALLTILFGLIAYILAGQFAVFAATNMLERQLSAMSLEATEVSLHLLHMPASAWQAGPPVIPEASPDAKESAARTLNIFRNGTPVVLGDGMPHADPRIAAAPGWASKGFSGIVRDGEGLYARAVTTRTEGTETITIVSSEPITQALLSRAAEGLGRVTITPIAARKGDAKNKTDDSKAKDSVNVSFGPASGSAVKMTEDGTTVDPYEAGRSLAGGTLIGKQNWADINVTFFTPFTLRDWTTGDSLTSPLSVSSRPSLLYHRLFASSVTLGFIIRWALISIAVMFAIIELIALGMAASLNRTITRSVTALYQGTVRVDKGDLTHRIPVRSHDQLGELGNSFNRMTASMVRLLEEQKEKERLQAELNIAQEVQANLFPHGDIRLKTLEVHGYSRPARTVGGDYYDFLLFGPVSLGLALGDISGKGISAALLMATLHSAVRAYRFAAEELADAELTRLALQSVSTEVVVEDCADMFESPGKILSLLNRHLYRSTQPEKYATLWLGFYNGANGRLTYSNGGQLPPLVLCASGEVKRLDQGGTVVGLMDNMEYSEGSVQLMPGDILIAYSDGVTEPENDFGDFGEDRLVEIVRQHRTAPLKDIADQVMQSLTDWIGVQEQPDDITLVLARQI